MGWKRGREGEKVEARTLTKPLAPNACTCRDRPPDDVEAPLPTKLVLLAHRGSKFAYVVSEHIACAICLAIYNCATHQLSRPSMARTVCSTNVIEGEHGSIAVIAPYIIPKIERKVPSQIRSVGCQGWS